MSLKCHNCGAELAEAQANIELLESQIRAITLQVVEAGKNDYNLEF